MVGGGGRRRFVHSLVGSSGRSAGRRVCVLSAPIVSMHSGALVSPTAASFGGFLLLSLQLDDWEFAPAALALAAPRSPHVPRGPASMRALRGMGESRREVALDGTTQPRGRLGGSWRRPTTQGKWHLVAPHDRLPALASYYVISRRLATSRVVSRLLASSRDFSRPLPSPRVVSRIVLPRVVRRLAHRFTWPCEPCSSKPVGQRLLLIRPRRGESAPAR